MMKSGGRKPNQQQRREGAKAQVGNLLSGSDRPFGAVGDGVFFDMEADFGFGRGWWGRHELADGFKEGTDGGIVALEALFQIGQFACKLFVEGQRLAQADEGPHDRDVDLNGLFAPQHARKQGPPVR